MTLDPVASDPTSYAETVIDARFNGPPSSANGGYAAGTVAGFLADPVVEVTLRRPPPLGLPVLVAAGAGRARMLHDGTLVAEAAVVADDLVPVDPVPLEAARAAESAYAGLRTHPFPTCFGCGPAREDGLRIFPGGVGEALVAATWTPDEAPDPPVVWAALDCVAAWSVGGLEDRPLVLGRMTARVDATPRVGEHHVVVAAHHGTEGRRFTTASTLYDEDGRIVALARHVWVAVDPARFG